MWQGAIPATSWQGESKTIFRRIVLEAFCRWKGLILKKHISLLAACVPLVLGMLCVACSSSSSSTSSAAKSSEYEVAITMEGGSGRATIQSPAKAVLQDGKYIVTIIWSSSNYDQMVVDGVQYLPVNKEGNSTFEIPITSLDCTIDVQAETTAMSAPHMIDYRLSFSSTSSSENGNTQENSTQKTIADFHNTDLGNGWQPTQSMELEYATCFTVDYYDGGYKLACLSDGGRYLVVPEGASVPQGIASDIVIIQQPLSNIYLVASDTMCIFDALDEMKSIAVSGISQDNWKIPAAVEAMKNGSIVYGGKYSMPDYDVLLSKGTRLAIESTMINHTPDVREKLIELGIPVMTEQSSSESEPLGRAEWVKLYGAIFNKEELASTIFDTQAAKAKSVDSTKTGKTVAFFYINSNGAAVVRKPGDYVTKMINMAGGEYIFNSLGDDSATSTVTLEMERFYTQAKDADIIIYNATIDSGVDSISDLKAKNELLGNFKAVKEGNVWVTGQDMYQQMLAAGDIIADFHTIFSGSNESTSFVQKMK